MFLQFITLLHIALGLLLLVTPDTQSLITPCVYPLRYLALGSPTLLAAEYLLTSWAVLWAMWHGYESQMMASPGRWAAAFAGALMQQLFVTVSAAGSVVAMVQGAYLDGTVVTTGHIVGDQIVYVLAAVFHVASIGFVYLRPALRTVWFSEQLTGSRYDD